MEVIIIENGNKKQIGKLKLDTQPRNGEFVEFNQNLYSIFKVVHTESNLKLMVIRIR